MVASTKRHVFGGTNAIIAEKAPHEKIWRVKYIDWNSHSGFDLSRPNGTPRMLYSGLDSQFDKEEFQTADAAIAFVLYRVALSWFKGQIERLSQVIPREAAMYQAALDHARSVPQPTTVEEVEMRAVSMAKSLSTWGETMFPEDETRERIETLLGLGSVGVVGVQG